MPYVFLFPGQGAQKAGMGKALAEAFPETAGEVFHVADKLLGLPLSRYCFEGPDEDLAQTEITQPALFTTSCAALAVLKKQGVNPVGAAGHSVGEYAALVAAGAVDFEAALPVVRRRGELMAAAVAETPGAMAAIISMGIDQVESICHDASAFGVVEPSNLNSPTQVVISGQEEAVLMAMGRVKEAGGKAIRLKVSAPFHCSMMASVTERLAPDIAAMPVRSPSVPVVANATASPVSDPAEIRQALLDQVESPVRWTETMQLFLDEGRRSFVEVGPGKVLNGLLRQLDASAEVLAGGTPDDIEQVVAQKI